MTADLITAAYLLAPHGLKGAVKAKGQIDDPAVLKGKPLPTGRDGKTDGPTLTVTRVQTAPRNQWILQFAETGKREDAEPLHGLALYLPKSLLPKGAAHAPDLVGRPVHDASGKAVGSVKAVQPSPGQTLLELTTGALIPAHLEYIEDLSAATLTLTEIGTELLELE